MTEAGMRRAAAALAVLVVGTLPAAGALAARGPAGSFVGGGTQARSDGLVTDATGGYYDPARSVYVPRSGTLGAAAGGRSARSTMLAGLRARSVALNQRYGLGAYALGTPPLSAAGAGPRGFSWRDASLGASLGAALATGLAGAALAARRRRRPAV